MIRRLSRLLLTCSFIFCSMAIAAEEPVRLKELGRFSGWRENSLVGYGIVTGLAGTGDSASSKATKQSLSNLLAQFNLNIPTDQIQSRNVAAVMVTASLPAFARAGETIDVTVTSVADARSLVGGALLLAPLKAADGKTYVLAQGPLSVGGYKYDLNGNVVQKNHPTVGSVPGGGTVELEVKTIVGATQKPLHFVLAQPDYATVERISAALNADFSSNVAKARDAGTVELQIPQHLLTELPKFIARVENIRVVPDRRARVVINERTGTVVAGADARISPISISHGDLKISIVTDNTVSQPNQLLQPGLGIQTERLANSRIEIDEKSESGFVAAGGSTVADLILALTRARISTRGHHLYSACS